ncbi:MAG TPA: YidC/Oxa1 family membrane protein insertase [Opitutaceae bacterium]|jgi:YidC/Oxa1 family membrane protein insertase|nr:YidC/Oxa1 family membrane protein insertase [Opitutaceae bacterium]
MTDFLVSLISFLDQVLGGSLGGAILLVSFSVRILLLPLSIRLARRARRNQALALSFQPEINAIKKKYENKPERVYEETMKVYKKHGYSPFDTVAMLGGFMQFPVFGLLYRSIKRALASSRPFLWIKSLSVPNVVLTLVILSLAGLTVYIAPSASEHVRAMMVVVSIIITSLIVWKLAAGLGLYWVASNCVGLVQALWLRRDVVKKPEAV